MLDIKIGNYFKDPCVDNVLDILNYLEYGGYYLLHHNFSKYFIKKYEDSVQIQNIFAKSCYIAKKYEESFEIYNKILDNPELTEVESKNFLKLQHLSSDYVSDKYTFYNKEKVQEILNRQNGIRNDKPMVTLTVTSCKRLSLFKQTINSIINCFDTENIYEFLCVDDNSTDEDRKEMVQLYPFFKFIIKNKEGKGHAISMNIIREVVKTPYIFHLEDDFKFFIKRDYIEEMLEIMNENDKIGQCLINKNYGETSKDIGLLGGEFHTTSESYIRYYIHENPRTFEEMNKWISKHGQGISCNYWPHFSFRPSLIRKEVLDKIGAFNKYSEHFERDYAYRYINQGYVSAFLEGIYCIHIGRLTSERHDETKLNAYILNGEEQFVKKKPENMIKIKNFVINLERRKDRFDNFKKNVPSGFEYERFDAIDGLKLTNSAQLQRIFEGNDYQTRRGCVGCALSHVQLYIKLINEESDDNIAYFIMEDDIEFCNHFQDKYKLLIEQISNIKDFDFLYLAHSPRYLDSKLTEADSQNYELRKWSRNEIIQKSLGGFYGYIITKSCAKKFLDCINNQGGMFNCIDTCLQVFSDSLNVYYITPFLVFTECFRGPETSSKYNTDIQVNNGNLEITFEKALENEIIFFKEKCGIDPVEIKLESFGEYVKNNEYFVVYLKEDIPIIKEECSKLNLKFYTIDRSKAIFVVKTREFVERYYHRFMINGKYSIQDCFL